MLVENEAVDVALRGLVLAALGLFWVMALIRINGLRSLSKMSNFDFVMTIALGSLLAGAAQASEWSAFAQALVGMVALFAVQWSMNQLRMVVPPFQSVVQNRPVILMRDGEYLTEAMHETRVSKSDLLAKLRKANALDFSRIRAVVLETTGDVSVLYGDRVEESLFKGLDAP